MNRARVEMTSTMMPHPDQVRTDLPRGDALLERALVVATAAHCAVGQRRKYTDELYIVHPKAVAEIVKSVPHTTAMVAAALLHDLVEDTQITPQLLVGMFGFEVTGMVMDLTDPPKDAGNRATRKAMKRAQLEKSDAAVQTVRLADILHNSESIKAYDPDFWVAFRHEVMLEMPILVKGDISLWNRAAEILDMEERR